MEQEERITSSIETGTPETTEYKEKYYVLKFKAVSDGAALYGGGVIIYNKEAKKVKRFTLGIGGDKRLRDININKDWHIFEDFIITEKMAGRLALTISQNITNILQDDFKNSESEIIIFLDNRDENSICKYLEGVLTKEIGQSDVVIQSRMDSFTEEEFLKTRTTPETETKTDAEVIKEIYGETQEKVSEEVYFNIKFILSPVKGIALKDLKVGTKVAVVLNDEREFAKYLVNLIKKDEEVVNDKIYGTVYSVDLIDPDFAKVIVKFGPGVYGIGKANQRIMVKVIADELPKKEISPQETVKKKKELNVRVVVIIAAVVFILLIIILIIFRI
ncbi:MAG: hypothetical protein AB1765_07965 [Candidatus Hydrogenedentota bacterium]